MNPDATMRCDVVLALVPTFVDGEVTESVASSVREHLKDCRSCRAAVQEERSLRQWFVPTEDVEVPDGFAARVARRAFAGDEGLAPVAPNTFDPEAGYSEAGVLVPFATAGATAGALAVRDGHGLLAFSRTLVAAAAAAMVAVTLIIASGGHPASQGLGASQDLDEALEALDEENRSLLDDEDPAETPDER
ncbi:MAG: zf-HC2 domain-containing protein [Planctomycetota bacterium]